MSVYNTVNNPNFINFLKKFEKDISTIHWSDLVPCCIEVNENLEILFNMYIDIDRTSVEEINIVLKEIDKHTSNRQIKNLVVGKLIYLLSYSSKNYSNQIIGEAITKKHLFGMS